MTLRSTGKRCSSSCPFQVLGVEPNATLSEIKDAHRELCKIHHPDVGGDEAKFKMVQCAYEECKARIESTSVGNASDYEHSSSSSSTSSSFSSKARSSSSSNSWSTEDAYAEFRSATETIREEKLSRLREVFRYNFSITCILVYALIVYAHSKERPNLVFKGELEKPMSQIRT